MPMVCRAGMTTAPGASFGGSTCQAGGYLDIRRVPLVAEISGSARS